MEEREPRLWLLRRVLAKEVIIQIRIYSDFILTPTSILYLSPPTPSSPLLCFPLQPLQPPLSPAPSSRTANWKFEFPVPAHLRKADQSSRICGCSYQDEEEAARARDEVYLQYTADPDPNKTNFPSSISKGASSSSTFSSRGEQSEEQEETDSKRPRTTPTTTTATKHKGVRKAARAKGTHVMEQATCAYNKEAKKQSKPLAGKQGSPSAPPKVKGKKERPAKCATCGKQAEAHLWYDGWTDALYRGNCEVCYVNDSTSKSARKAKGTSKTKTQLTYRQSNYRGVRWVPKKKVRPWLKHQNQ